MSRAPLSVISKFRETYSAPSHLNVGLFKTWYPGHMHKGIKVMQGKALRCDFLVEVHDARIPISGRNLEFTQRLYSNHKMLVLNKIDLAKQSRLKVLRTKFEEADTVFYCNSKTSNNSSVKKLIQFVKDSIKEEEEELEEKSYKVLVCGIPNTGKSTLINHIRRINVGRGKAAPVGPYAGVTKSVMMKILVNENPKVYVVDTPGILTPNIGNIEEGMKLAAVGSFKDSAIGEDIIADYILFIVNKLENFRYTELFNMPRPTDDFDILVAYIAKKMGFIKNGYPDILRSSIHFITCFRKGWLGRFTLD